MTQPMDNVTVVPAENNMASWEVTIAGPVRSRHRHTWPGVEISVDQELIFQPGPSPYSGGKFKLGVEFGLDYPFKAPQVCCQTTWRPAACCG
jgi:ubiquitin-protein ligase